MGEGEHPSLQLPNPPVSIVAAPNQNGLEVTVVDPKQELSKSGTRKEW